MKILKITTSIAILFFIGTIWSQNNTSLNDKEKVSYSITSNPAYFALGGYSVKGNIILPKRWTFGLAVEGGLELPDSFRDSFFDDNEAIDVKWDYLVGIEAHYRFNDANYNKGLYAYGTLGYEGWTVDEISTGEEDSFDNWYASIGLGYNWYPFRKKNFYVGAAYNVIFILNNTDNRTVGNTTYNINGVVPPSLLPNTIHIGWRF